MKHQVWFQQTGATLNSSTCEFHHGQAYNSAKQCLKTMQSSNKQDRRYTDADMWKHLRACVCGALLLVPFSQLHGLANKIHQSDTHRKHTHWTDPSALPSGPVVKQLSTVVLYVFPYRLAHTSPYPLLSLQIIPIAVLTAWSGNRGLPCRSYPLLSSQLDQETEAFLANPSFFGLCYPNFTTISVTDVSFHPSLVWFRNMYPFLTIAITLVWLAWLTGCHKPI